MESQSGPPAPGSRGESSWSRDELEEIVEGVLAEHLFEFQSRMDGMKAKVEGLLGRMTAVEQSTAAMQGDLEEVSAEAANPRMPPQAVESILDLEKKVEKLGGGGELPRRSFRMATPTDEDMPTREVIRDKFGEISAEMTELQESQEAIRRHFMWFEQEMEHWRVSWAVFALRAASLPERQRRECLSVLQEEELLIRNRQDDGDQRSTLASPKGASPRGSRGEETPARSGRRRSKERAAKIEADFGVPRPISPSRGTGGSRGRDEEELRTAEAWQRRGEPPSPQQTRAGHRAPAGGRHGRSDPA
jgi:hypothetical protein